MSPVFRAILAYNEDSERSKQRRMDLNKINWDVYHLRQNWDHKKKGQSKEFLPKQTQSVEQITSFLQQGLMDVGEWFRVEAAPGVNPASLLLQPEDVKKLLFRQLEKNNFITFMSDTLKSGLLNSTMTIKIGGKRVSSPRYEVELKREEGVGGFFKPMKRVLVKVNNEVWQLHLTLVRPEHFFQDPTGDGLYQQEMIEMDYHELLKLAEENPKDFNLDVVRDLQKNTDALDEADRSRQTNQIPTEAPARKRVRFIEHWGTICDPDTGEMLYENVVARFTPDGHEISSPRQNQLWHQMTPYVTGAILRVPWSVEHKALMDSPSALNRAENEIFNLQFDGAMMSVFGVKQLREDWLENPEEVSDGIAPASTLKVNSQCPPGMKVLERIDTGVATQESMTMYQVLDREFLASAFTSDIRMGNLPQRGVKATEIVASNQAISGVFNGIVKQIETGFLVPTLEKAWLMCAQHMDDLDSNEVKAILGEDKALKLSMVPPEERFALTAQGFIYKVFGLSTTLNKIQDFKKIATLLQTIGTSEILIKEFLRKYSVTKLLGEVLRSLDIDASKLEPDKEELMARQAEAQQAAAMQMMEMQAKMQGKGGGGRRTMEQGADTGSQMSNMNEMSVESGVDPSNNANDNGMTTPGM